MAFNQMWDQRFAATEYAYGTMPNDFLKQSVSQLKKGKVLSLAEGEGRNAVFLAKLGFDVTAVDASIEGLKKAEQLATRENVTITTVLADLSQFDLGENQWDSVISIFGPFGSCERAELHKKVVKSLKKQGTFLIEAYTPEQLKFATGGGNDSDSMPTAEQLKDELTGLNFLSLNELNREVIEGQYHTGMAAVVQGIATK